MKNCKFCKQTIGRDKRSDSEFCCNSCKARYHEAKKNNPGSEQVLSGFVPDFSNEQTPNESREQPEPLENLLDPPKERPAPPPPQYITATVEIPNPDYESLKQKYDQIQNAIRIEEDTKKRLVKQLEQAQADDSATIYIFSSMAGAGAGYLIGNNAHDIKDTPNENKDKKLAGVVFGGLFGFIGGLLIDEFTSEQRKKDKATAIKYLRSQIANSDKKLFILGQDEQTIGKKMLGLPRTIKTQKQIENPAFKNYELGKVIKGLDSLSALIKNEISEVSPTNLPVPSTASASLETDRIMQASTVANLDLPRLNFTGRWFQFLGKPQPRFFCLVHGMSGHGKSHFAFQLAEYLARNFGRVLYVSSEEGFSATLQEKINTLNIVENRLMFSDFKSAEDLIQNAPNRFHFFVLDSITNMQLDPSLLAKIRQHYNQSGIIGICQNTKNGGIRGSNEFVFDSDMVINVENGIASTTKNRFCPYLASFKVFENFNGKNKGNKKPPKPDNDGLDEDFRNII